VLIMLSLLDNNIYISVLYYNSDVEVMSRENKKNFTYVFFVKCGALHPFSYSDKASPLQHHKVKKQDM
jgi:hypothetical protein